MQLREIEIDRFGIWQDVTLPFNERGVTVLYGPNEAGKSTLLRFIRGVLYGYLPQDEKSYGPDAKPIECSGTLRLTHHGKEYRLRRISQPGSRGRLEINGRIVRDDDALLRSIVAETREQMFQNIFAIGLPELQQLATLSGDEVAEHIYGLSLGPEGEQIFRAHNGFAAEERGLVNGPEREGELFKHISRLGQLDRELGRHAPVTEKHSKLQDYFNQLENQISAVIETQEDTAYDLRSRQFVNRIWAPWQRDRELRSQLAKLPQDDIDRQILARFDALEIEHSAINDNRQKLIADAKKLQEDSDAIPTRPELEENACAIQNLFERSRIMQALDKSLAGSQAHFEQSQRGVQQLIGKLHGNWDIKRVESSEIGPAAYQRLWNQAGAYRSASRKRHRLIQRYKKMSGSLNQLRLEWKKYTKDLGKLTIPEARNVLQKRLQEMEELRGLKVRREHLRKALKLLDREIGPQVIKRELPPFFWFVHSLFTIGGLVLIFGGLYAWLKGYTGVVAGGPTAFIAGAIFFLLGLCSIFVVWSMKEYFETVEFSTPDIDRERATLELELGRVEQSIDRIVRRDASLQLRPVAKLDPGPIQHLEKMEPTVPPPPLTDEEIIRRIRQQLQELDEHEPIGRRIDRLRNRLSTLRTGIHEQQRLHGRVRRDWTETLRRLGLSETLKVSAAFEQCQILAEARQRLREFDARNEKEAYQRQELNHYLTSVRELAVKLESHDFKLQDPYQALGNWNRELQLQGERRRERARLRQSAKEKRQQAAQLVDQIDQMRRERAVLLKKLGVDGRDQIIAKLAAIDERNSLQLQLKSVTDDLQRLISAEPEIALVDSDLKNYDQVENNQKIDEHKIALANLETELQSLRESLKRTRTQLNEIESDRTLSSLRFDREQILYSLRESTEKWVAARLADQVLNRVRYRIEHDRQPQSLQDASAYLEQFTLGKYKRIWTRIGEKALLVDDEKGNAYRVEQLSSGTREQVFLSVRLAMIRDFSRKGTEMPMILDDVTVNFDQGRTEAAAKLLMKVADQGQQVLLLTCHQHFAQIFQQEGHEPIYLPALRGEAQLQR